MATTNEMIQQICAHGYTLKFLPRLFGIQVLDRGRAGEEIVFKHVWLGGKVSDAERVEKMVRSAYDHLRGETPDVPSGTSAASRRPKSSATAREGPAEGGEGTLHCLACSKPIEADEDFCPLCEIMRNEG